MAKGQRRRRQSAAAAVTAPSSAATDIARPARRASPGKAQSARALALHALDAVLVHGRALDGVLGELRPRHSNSAEAALCAELTYGVLRWLPQLDAVLGARLERPLKPRDTRLRHTVLLGLYQLLHARTPSHAAVHETVALAQAPWAKGLVNAVLRAVAANPQAAVDALRGDVARHAHPQWLLDAFAASWPGQAQDIASAGNQRPPMTLRVNARHCTRDDYLARLEAAGHGASRHPLAQHALVLDTPVAVEQLPGWADGDVSVQDAAAQLCAPLLGLEPGQRLLDACSAPGGKCAHALESEPALAHVLALDASETRLQRVHGTLARLGLNATLCSADARATASWHDGQAFDRILVDAPCSGSGVIRRHPDIKLLRRAQDIEAMALRQRALLDGTWPALRSGGRLLYVTCSVLEQENDAVLDGFLADQADACAHRPGSDAGVARFGTPTRHGQQVLPGQQDMDGFYFAVIARG